MTVKELIKKVEVYNEVAEHVNGRTAELRVLIGDFAVLSETVGDWKHFRSYVTDMYIGCVAEKILEGKEYDFNKPVTVTCVDKFGDELHETIEFVLWSVSR